MRKTLAAVLILTGCAIASEKMVTVYKLTKMSPTEVGIYCQNGADPTGKKIGEVLIISCGK